MAQNNNKLSAAIQKRDDEYYTHYGTVEWIVNEFLKDRLEDKIIYCNCDSEQSNFVKYFKAHKEELKYKDLWFTSDDYRNHYDLMQKCDIIITNPPFSLFNKFYFPDLLKYAKEFFVFSNFLNGYNVNKYIYSGEIHKLEWSAESFTRPDGSEKLAHVCLLTNMEGFENRRYNSKKTGYRTTINFSKKFDEIEHVYFDELKVEGQDLLNIDKISDYPIDYDGYVGVPSTSVWLCMDKLEILGDVERHDSYVNGKAIFRRTICRLKKNEDK